MKKRVLVFLLTLSAVVAVGRVQAQIFTPTFMSPQLGGDLGVYLNDGPGNFSVEGIWRRNLGTYDLGFRGGVADGRDAILLVGAELRTPLQVGADPLAMALTAGVQGAIGDGGAAGFQGGVTIGYPVQAEGFVFVPYIHPRLGLVSAFRRDDFELEVLADLGLDFVLQQNITFRVGFGLGDPTSSWGIGFAWR